jgi:hypothetical protein
MKVAGLVLAGVLLAGCGTTAAANPDATHLNVAVRELHEGQVVDSVPCLRADLPEHHMHVHVGIYVDGVAVKVPAGIGVGRPWGFDNSGFLTNGSCFAWLHTHDTTGVIHIATPELTVFTLGQFFDVWGQPLTTGGPFNYSGTLAVLVNGRRHDGDPGSIAFNSFENIVLELGTPPAVPPASLYEFGSLQK